jgi:hypothetical protein
MSPNGVSLDSVYGTAADDKTFIVTGDRVRVRGIAVMAQWYLLRITPGSKTVARLTPLPIPVHEMPAGVALSPDGTKVAVALPATAPAVLQVYSVATGALLRNWSAPTGQIMAVKAQPGSWQFTANVLRWSADGRKLGFTWNATEIRELDATAPNGNLLATSSTLTASGTVYTPAGTSVACNPTQGWDLVDGGSGFICAGTWRTAGAVPGTGTAAGSGQASAGKCPGSQLVTFGFELVTPYGQGGTGSRQLAPVAVCTAQVQPADGAYIAWANADGSVVIGSQAWDGHSRFGIFKGNAFTPLPQLPPSLPVPTGILDGTDAW